MFQRVHAVAALAGLFVATPALAQVPAELIDKIAAIGRVSDPAKTGPLYAPMHAKEPYAGVKVTRDMKYGPHERNTLDLFVPEGGGSARPIFMFVHGGGFVRGNKRSPDSPFYDNIMLWANRNGMVGVNIEYRLAPAAPWPAGQEDIAMAVRWAANNAAANGADANRIYLMGHSAGATHVAIYVGHPEFHAPKALAGAMFSSGGYDLMRMEEGESRAAYFGADRSLYAQRSALPCLVKATIPFMPNAAEPDPPWSVEQTEPLQDTMT